MCKWAWSRELTTLMRYVTANALHMDVGNNSTIYYLSVLSPYCRQQPVTTGIIWYKYLYLLVTIHYLYAARPSLRPSYLGVRFATIELSILLSIQRYFL